MALLSRKKVQDPNSRWRAACDPAAGGVRNVAAQRCPPGQLGLLLIMQLRKTMWKVVSGIVGWVVAAGVAGAAVPSSPPVCADCARAVVVAEAKDASPIAARTATAPAAAAVVPESQGYALMLAGVAALIFMAGRRRRD
jgi:hypothetical protein